jgi:hypothetical protein
MKIFKKAQNGNKVAQHKNKWLNYVRRMKTSRTQNNFFPADSSENVGLDDQ